MMLGTWNHILAAGAAAAPKGGQLEGLKSRSFCLTECIRSRENFTFFHFLGRPDRRASVPPELQPVGGPASLQVDQGGSSEPVELGGPEPSRRRLPLLAHRHRTSSGTSVGRDCQAESAQRVHPSYLVSSLAALLTSLSLIRRMCQHANRISSCNISLKSEGCKENEGLVTPLFLLSASHLPFGQAVPIRERPSSRSTHSPLSFWSFFKKCYTCLSPSLFNPAKSQGGCIYHTLLSLSPARKS